MRTIFFSVALATILAVAAVIAAEVVSTDTETETVNYEWSHPYPTDGDVRDDWDDAEDNYSKYAKNNN
jgi:hypothetical protein